MLTKVYLPTLLHVGYLFNTIQCINIINYLIFGGSDKDSPNKNSSDNKEEKNKKMEEYIDEKMKINLRSKKINSLKPIYTNTELETNYYIDNNETFKKLYANYPICEAKYKLVDKLKSFKIFKKLMTDKPKKIILFKTCIVELYGMLSVTIRNVNNFSSVIATVYGYVPFLIMILTVFGFIITFNKNLLYIIFIMPTQTLISDLFLKRIFKKPRPINSALPTYGMPSSHSSFAIALLTFLLLHITEQKKDKWSIITYVIATLTLLPIPWSRVEVEDHTVLQVIVGSLVGIGFGFIFYFMKKYFFKHKDS